MTKLRQENSVDELLRAQSKFFTVKDAFVSNSSSFWLTESGVIET